MGFCPQCRYEYNPGVRTCPDCGTDLVDELPSDNKISVKKFPHEETSSNIRFVPLPNLPGRIYTEMVKEVLDQKGIPCYIQAESVGGVLRTAGTGFPSSSTMLYVPEDKLEECIQIQHQMLDHI